MNRTEVKINGITYIMSGEESEEYLQRVGQYIDRKLREVYKTAGVTNDVTAAVLACMQVADDYYKNAEGTSHLREQVVQYAAQASKDMETIRRLEEEKEQLQREINGLKFSLAAKEAALAEAQRRLRS